MSYFFKVLMTIAVVGAVVQSFPHIKPLIVKTIQATPVSSKVLGPPKGLVSAQELIVQREANLLFKGEAHEVRCNPVLPEMFSKVKHPEPYVLHIPRARIYGERGIVISPFTDKILDDTAFEFGSPPENCFVLKEFSLPAPHRLKGKTALLASIGYNNYYHWMFNILPRLALLQTKGIEVEGYLLPSKMPRYMRESLDFLGVGQKVHFLEATGHYECDDLVYPSLPCRHPTAYVPKWVCQWLRKSFHTWRKSGKVYAKNIVVSRSKSSGKYMLNEEELLKRLEPYGFVCVHLEDMALEDQVGLFGQVEIVIASHGAGLANLVFSNMGTNVIEIFPPYQSYTPTYALLCQLLKLDHTPIFLQEENLRSRQDYTVNIDQVEQMVWCMMQDSGIQTGVEEAVALWP